MNTQLYVTGRSANDRVRKYSRLVLVEHSKHCVLRSGLLAPVADSFQSECGKVGMFISQ